jgi:naphtho-gamma-pyrone polyketide synthase
MGLGVPRSGKSTRPVPAIKIEEAPRIIKKASPATTPVTKQNLAVAETFTSPKLSVGNRALAIVAEEVGLNVSDLAPSANFADFGVDSLLSLNIASRFREELELEVESSLFADCPTVKDLLAFLPGGKDTPPSTVASSAASVISTPELEHLSAVTSTTDETDYTLIDASEAVGDESNLLATIRLTIAEEVGIPLEEMIGTLAFSDVGLDSLLSLTVLGKLREVLDTELPSSLFQDNNSLNEIEAALGLKPSSKEIIIPSSTKATTVQHATIKPFSHPPASSILLQGNPRVSSKILFLFPDGSGSATSYAPLPKLSSNIAVYGLNCPYMKTPELMTCSLEELTPSYVSEIRRRQPHGPYYFGGWSAGGICAFDAAQQLDREGERVERLVLIDSPFPIGLEKLPPRLYDFFNSIGLFGSGEKAPPSWLLPHFLAFVDSLDKYRAVPFANGGRNAPQTHIIWAKDGVCKNPGDSRPKMRDDDPKEMKWLLNNRTDFSSNGWEALIGTGNCVVNTMSDANHFTMMEGQKVHELADFVRKALA